MIIFCFRFNQWNDKHLEWIFLTNTHILVHLLDKQCTSKLKKQFTKSLSVLLYILVFIRHQIQIIVFLAYLSVYETSEFFQFLLLVNALKQPHFVLCRSLNSNNFIGRIPATIGYLSKLYWLDLADNKLTGTLPVSSGSSPGLDMLLHTKHLYASPLFVIVFYLSTVFSKIIYITSQSFWEESAIRWNPSSTFPF